MRSAFAFILFTFHDTLNDSYLARHSAASSDDAPTVTIIFIDKSEAENVHVEYAAAVTFLEYAGLGRDNAAIVL